MEEAPLAVEVFRQVRTPHHQETQVRIFVFPTGNTDKTPRLTMVGVAAQCFKAYLPHCTRVLIRRGSRLIVDRTEGLVFPNGFMPDHSGCAEYMTESSPRGCVITALPARRQELVGKRVLVYCADTQELLFTSYNEEESKKVHELLDQITRDRRSPTIYGPAGEGTICDPDNTMGLRPH